MLCAAPEVTITPRLLIDAAAREMTWAWPESSRALDVRITHRATGINPSLRNRIGFRVASEVRMLLDNRLKVERTGIVTRHSGGAGQVQPQIELVGPGTEVASGRNRLAEKLKAST